MLAEEQEEEKEEKEEEKEEMAAKVKKILELKLKGGMCTCAGEVTERGQDRHESRLFLPIDGTRADNEANFLPSNLCPCHSQTVPVSPCPTLCSAPHSGGQSEYEARQYTKFVFFELQGQ